MYNKANCAIKEEVSEAVKRCISYNPESGVFIWKDKFSKYSKVSIGDVAGSRGKTATKISINGIHLNAHRVAWYLFYGEWPLTFVDHKNNDPNDNRIENLRLADRAQNSANRRSKKGGSSRYLGVCYAKKSNKWQAAIGTPRTYLGQYKTEKEAALVYNEAAERLYGEFARLNEVT